MNIILLKDIEHVGDKHEIVKVKNGYGRNYLIPMGFAVIANESNSKKLENLKQKEVQEELAKLEEYQELAEKIINQVVRIGVKSGTSGKIFGSVTELQVKKALENQFDIEIARKKIILPEDIKEIGTYPVSLKFHEKVIAPIEIELVSE